MISISIKVMFGLIFIILIYFLLNDYFKNKYKFKCSFCKREIKGKTFGGSIGKMDLCNDCSVELADTIYHAFDKKFGKHICDKLDRIYLKDIKKK